MTITARIKGIARWIAEPPFNGLIWLAWFYVVFACLITGRGPFAGDLVWFDDRVRLVQIFDWLNGQSWYDRTITRVNAPEGFHSIWSRVVDLPVAGIIAVLQNWMSQMQAAMIASIIMPLAQTLMLFYAASYFSRPLVGKPYAKLVALFVFFSSCINPESFTLAGFQVGMIGHHAWYVLLTLTLFGAMARLILLSDTRDVIIAGLSIGGLLTIGIECFPLIAGACGLLALISLLHNRPRLSFDGARLTALGYLCGLATLPANQPFDKLLSISFVEPSMLGPILIFAAMLFFCAQFLILKKYGNKWDLTLVASLLTAAVILATLIYLFPQILDGGATGLSPEERKMAAEEHTEAQSLFKVAIDAVDYIRMIVPPLIAVIFAFFLIRNVRNDRQKPVYIFYAGLVALTFFLASVYSRYFHYLDLMVCPWLLLLWLTLTKKMAHGDARYLTVFGLYVALGPLWLWIIPAANFDLGFGSHVLLFPAKIQAEHKWCDTRDITDYLDAHYSADKTIIVPMYTSDRFLLHTHLRIFFLANFPSDNKFIEAKGFYDTTVPDEARQIAERHKIQLVAICKNLYLQAMSPLTMELAKNHMSFGRKLISGQAPDWLKPVDVRPSPWQLFEVDQTKLQTAP